MKPNNVNVPFGDAPMVFNDLGRTSSLSMFPSFFIELRVLGSGLGTLG